MDYLTDEGDLHVCGFCKQTFSRLDQWLEHKQLQWCKTSYRLNRSISQQQEMIALANASSQDGGGDLHRPYRLSREESSEPQDMSTGTSRAVVTSPSLRAGAVFSAPIKRSLYPIMPPNRKRERARSRKQESPQPLVKLEKSSPTSSFGDTSLVPTSPGEERDGPDGSLYKRPRGRPKKEPGLSVIVTPSGATSSPGLAAGSSIFSPNDQPISNEMMTSHSRRPLVLPRVYSCPRCSKSFIKLSHLHRHMNKKKPCEAKDAADAIDDTSETEEIITMPLEVSFTCGLCSEQFNCYDDIINHHSEKHPAYYPGYCRFCGKFQDRKNKLLIHLVKHDHSQIVDEVAQEVKRIRHIKIDKPPPASQLTISSISTSTSHNHPSGGTTTSGSIAYPPLVTPHTSSSSAEVICPCCELTFPDRDELVCHFRDFHTPVGCYVMDSDILEFCEDRSLSASTSSMPPSSPELFKCFICCLRFTSKDSFEQHIDFHKVWSEKVEPLIPNGSSDSEVKEDENRNTKKTPNNEADLRDGVDGGVDSRGESPGDSVGSCIEDGQEDASESNNNNNSEHVMDLSLGNKAFPKSSLMLNSSISTTESNGSPEETVSLDYPCWLCNDQHSDLETWRDHISSAHKIPLLFRCVVDECRQEFLTWNDLYDHRSEHSQRSYVCKICNDHQTTQESLVNHSQCHTLTKRIPATCTYCQCFVQENMEIHRSTCSQQLVNCPECNEKTKRLALMKHILTHSTSTNKSYRCDNCDSTFPLRDRLTQHVKNVHGPRKFVCTDCGAAFKRNDKLQRHCQSRHSDLKPYLCPIVSCGRAFKRIDGLRAHVRCSHVAEALAHLVKNHYGCTVCGKLVSGQERLVDHLMSHVKASPPSVMSSSLSGELFGGSSDYAEDGSMLLAPPPPSTSALSVSALPQYECPHCHIKVPNEALFYAHLVQHSQVAAFRSPVLPFAPGGFFFPFGQNAAASGSKTSD